MFTVQTIHHPMNPKEIHQIQMQPNQNLQTIHVIQTSPVPLPPQQQHQQPQHQQQQLHQLEPQPQPEQSKPPTKRPKAPRKPRKEKVPKKPKKEKIAKRKTNREIIDKQGRGIVFNVYMFLKAMHMRQQCQQPVKFAKTQELTAQACGIGKRTVQRIIKEGRISLETNEQPIFESPVKPRSVPRRINKLDDMDCFILRRTVHEFYDQKMFPTVKQILPGLSDKINFQGSSSSLRRILKDLGFSYRKAPDGTKFLMERADIVAARVKFLRTMHELRESDPRTVYYVGESTIDPNLSLLSQDPLPKSKTPGIIICHVGSANTGFLSQSKLVLSNSKLNSQIFKTWFLKILEYIHEPSVIVMDNSAHHSRLMDLVPGAASRKSEIVEWLWRYGIAHDIKQTRAELLTLVKVHQPKMKSYELDTIASEKGHTVVRLPPYHNQYNPIEMVWAQVKSEVAELNKTRKLADVEVIVNQVLDTTVREVWEQSVTHAEQLQEEDFKKELHRDQCLESIAVVLESDDSDDDLDTDDDENDEVKL